MASAISLGVVASAGRFSAVVLPQSASLTAAARRIPSRVRRGEDSEIGVPGGTKQRPSAARTDRRSDPLK